MPVTSGTVTWLTKELDSSDEAGAEEEVIKMIASSGAYPLKVEEITDNLNFKSSIASFEHLKCLHS